MYAVRFFISVDTKIFESNPIKPTRLSLYTTKHETHKLYLDNNVECLWFEYDLPFIPSVRMRLSNIPISGYIWDDGMLPIVVYLEYSFKHQVFLVKLDWMVLDQIEILDRIHEVVVGISKNA